MRAAIQPDFNIARIARRLFIPAVALLVASEATMHPRPASAAEPVWPSEPYKYTIVDQDLGVVLQEFGRNTGLRLEISPEIRGRVRGPLPELAAKEFLEHLAKNYGLDWYFDGFRLYVSSGKEASSRLLQLGAVPLRRLEAALRDLTLYDTRFSLRAIDQADMAMVAGPPHYIEAVERTLAALKPRPDQPSSVTVYRGEHVHVVKLSASAEPP